MNDEWAVSELNQKFRTDKFAVLPEPVSAWKGESDFDVRDVKKKGWYEKKVGKLSTSKDDGRFIK